MYIRLLSLLSREVQTWYVSSVVQSILTTRKPVTIAIQKIP